METARFDGASLTYEITGTGEPVVFIHGVLIADTFRPLLGERKLADRYTLIHYHRRGYAGSGETSDDPSLARQAADCWGLLRYLGIERAHVVGHSYGGAVALQLALDKPEIVLSLSLLEPALAVGTSARGYRESLLRAIDRYRAEDAAMIVDEFVNARWPGYRAALDRMLPKAFVQAVDDAVTTFEHDMPGLLDWRFSEAEARQISRPTLSILGGDSDTLSSRFGEAHRLLLEWLPDAVGVVIPRTTHFMQLQDPPGTAKALAAFWANHPIR